MWPFGKKTKPQASDDPVVILPVDLEQPVENPDLVAAIAAAKATPSDDANRLLIDRLNAAVFLVVTKMEGLPEDAGADQVTLDAGETDGILCCSDSTGAPLLTLFTDWNEINAWTNEPVTGLVMPAEQAWAFALDGGYAGAVINPEGEMLEIGVEQLRQLVDDAPLPDASIVSEDENKRVMQLTSDVAMQTRIARAVPKLLRDAIRDVCENNADVQACVLLDMRRQGSAEVKLLIDLTLSEGQDGDSAAFETVTGQLQEVLQSFPDYIPKALITAGGRAAKYMPDALFKRTVT